MDISFHVLLLEFINSRQRYVLGDSAMLRLAKCSVFISGMGGLGIETGKAMLMLDGKQLSNRFFINIYIDYY